MYREFYYQIAQERIADLHRQARHDALARASQSRRARKRQSGHRVLRLPSIVARRLRTA